jgi:putative membrane protein
MAADRTLMAWIRTALSMLSFGFTIYKFLGTIAEQGGVPPPHSPRQVGLFLAALGTACMVFGTISYWMTLKDLQAAERFRIVRPVLWVGVIISIAGVTLFYSIVRRAV